jgi:hypothetical protein
MEDLATNLKDFTDIQLSKAVDNICMRRRKSKDKSWDAVLEIYVNEIRNRITEHSNKLRTQFFSGDSKHHSYIPLFDCLLYLTIDQTKYILESYHVTNITE